MKKYKKILEAILKGINIALDDFEDKEILTQKVSKLSDKNLTKEYIDLMNEVIDLGLPSGTLWRKYNLGVNINLLSKPEDWYGNYYAWGEIEPKPKNINKTHWANYKFCKGLDLQDHPIFTKYITKYKDAHGHDITYVDNLTHLQLEDDAAYQLNNRFQIPSVKLIEELIDLESKWINNYNNIKGLSGIIFRAENGNEIFFPAAGTITENGIKWRGEIASILSNEISPLNLQVLCGEMWGNLYDSRSDITDQFNLRCRAFSIRPVVNLK